jgi:hypothetical protein
LIERGAHRTILSDKQGHEVRKQQRSRYLCGKKQQPTTGARWPVVANKQSGKKRATKNHGPEVRPVAYFRKNYLFEGALIDRLRGISQIASLRHVVIPYKPIECIPFFRLALPGYFFKITIE